MQLLNLLKSPSYGLSRTAVYLMVDRTILQYSLQSICKVFIPRCQQLIETKLQFKSRFRSHKLPKKNIEHITTSNSDKNRNKCKTYTNRAMWESHYLFSNINFNSVSALRMSILLLSSLKNLIIFFKIKTSFGTNNNIITRIKISMSKNTESIDITKVQQQPYTKNKIHIFSDTFDLNNQSRLFFDSNIVVGNLFPLQWHFLLLKKQYGLKSNNPRGFSPLPKTLECKVLK